MKRASEEPELVLRNGKPTAVILGIEEYQEMLERLEDLADLKTLQKMRKRRLSFNTLDEFLRAGRSRVRSLP